MSPRACRWKSGRFRLSSSALIWRETADWLRLSISPAWVKLPASATAWKIRSLSQSIIAGAARFPYTALLGCFCSSGVLFDSKEALCLERGHAAHAGGGYCLAEDLVLDVARCIHAGNAGRRRIGRRLYIAFRIHRWLAVEDLRRRVMADCDE